MRNNCNCRFCGKSVELVLTGAMLHSKNSTVCPECKAKMKDKKHAGIVGSN